jgi:hypothetical protein
MTKRSLLLALGAIACAGMTMGALAQQRGGGGAPGAAGGGRGRGGAQPATLIFKEGWKDTTTMIPMSQASVSNPDLELKMYGTGKEDFSITNEGGVNHIWTGLCAAGCGVSLRNKDNFVDLTGKAKIRWFIKTSGFHEVRPMLKLADGSYVIGDHIDSSTIDYRESEFYISEVHWLKIDMTTVVTKGKVLEPAQVDLSKVDEIGFVDLTPGSGHGDGGYSDVGWIEVYGKAVKR